MTVGYGDIIPYTIEEKIFSIIIMFVGSQIIAFSISNIGEIFNDIFKKSNEFK